jgi:TonB family protein
MDVMLFPAPPSPAQSQVPPPKPEPREEPKVETPPKPPEPREEVQAKAAEPKINPDKVDEPPEEPAEEAASESENEGVLEQEAPGVPKLPGMEGRQYDWYRAAINRALSAAWRKPFVQTTEESLDVLVGFEILRDGSVRGVQIVSSSGFPALDRSAERAVYDASLPPLPRNFREPTQPARVIFRYFSDSM